MAEPFSLEELKGKHNLSKIDDGLYQGGDLVKQVMQLPVNINGRVVMCEHISDMVPQFIQAVLSLRSEYSDNIANASHLKAYAWMGIDDHPDAFPGIEWLNMAVSTIELWRAQNWSTLIHCHAGVSRAGMVMAAYLMRSRDMSRDAALAFIRRNRPQCGPNFGFMVGLQEWEKFLQKGKVLLG